MESLVIPDAKPLGIHIAGKLKPPQKSGGRNPTTIQGTGSDSKGAFCGVLNFQLTLPYYGPISLNSSIFDIDEGEEK